MSKKLRNTSTPRDNGGAVGAVAYVRVSTGEQSTENQLPELRQMASARGLTMGRVYSEHAGAGSYRPVFQELMRDAHGGKFGVLLISAIDRLGRSMSGNCAALLQFERAGIRVVSAREPWLDSGGPARALLVAVFSWVAEQERQLISERTKKGLVRVKAAGTRLGRPKRHVDQRALVLLKGGDSLRQVAQRFKIPKSTLARHLAANTRVP